MVNPLVIGDIASGLMCATVLFMKGVLSREIALPRIQGDSTSRTTASHCESVKVQTHTGS